MTLCAHKRGPIRVPLAGWTEDAGLFGSVPCYRAIGSRARSRAGLWGRCLARSKAPVGRRWHVARVGLSSCTWKQRTGKLSRGAGSVSSPGKERCGPMAKRVLVIAAHPDDELLGCGGTVALHTQAQDQVTAVIACEGESLRYGPGGIGQRSHIESAAQKLGVLDVRLLGFPDQQLDTITLTK